MKNIFKCFELCTITALTLVFFAGCSNGSKIGTENISLKTEDFYKTLTSQNTEVSFPESMDGNKCYLIYSNETNKPIKIKDVVPDFDSFNYYRSIDEDNQLNDQTGVYTKEYSHNYRDAHFDIPELSPEYMQQITNSNSRAATSNSIRYNPNLPNNNLIVGKTKVEFYYIQNNQTINEINYDFYDTKEFLLMAENDKCRIWRINDSSFDDKCDYNSLAKNIENNYKLMLDIFGTNVIPKNNIGISASENTKLEVLVYDIYNDNEEGRTMGFFNPADLFLNTSISSKISNECEVIHIDSYFLNNNLNTVLSTLLHEFQHLLNFINKHDFTKDFNKVDISLKYDDWFTEMLSQCCEEIFQERLGINDNASPKNRFNYGYKRTDLGFKSHWRDNYYSHAYANAYAFGTYLMRNYGGIKLIHDIATNGYVNEAAINIALKNNNYKETFYSVLRKFPLVNIMTEYNYPYSLNNNVESRYNEIFCTFTRIDLNEYPFFNFEYDEKNDQSYNFYIDDRKKIEIGIKEKTIKGPLVFYPNSYWKIDNDYDEKAPIEPYGFLIYYLGTVDSSRTYKIRNNTELTLTLVVK